ncbi:hypothetical protein LQK93_00178 [Terrabacter sp. BE26]
MRALYPWKGSGSSSGKPYAGLLTQLAARSLTGTLVVLDPAADREPVRTAGLIFPSKQEHSSVRGTRCPAELPMAPATATWPSACFSALSVA